MRPELVFSVERESLEDLRLNGEEPVGETI
jgi:hypothetical protein